MKEALLGSVLAAMSTGVGALPILFLKNSLSHRWKDTLLAFTAGIMMAAATLSLIPEALAYGGFLPLGVGLLFGVIVLTLLEKSIPHIDLEHNRRGIAFDQKAMLIVAAITLHNIPEGLSVGVSYASDTADTGNLIAFAIGLQNAPEGFLVALFLINQKITRLKAFLVATLTGAVEVPMAILGFYLTSVVASLVVWTCICCRGHAVYHL